MRLYSRAIVSQYKYQGVYKVLQVCCIPEYRAECGTVLKHTPTYAANSRAVLRLSASNREARSWTSLFSMWGRPVQRLSWMASLPSHYALTHSTTVRCGNTASPHASCSLWKHSCVLRPRAISILIQECCSSSINMALWLSHYPFESQRSTDCSRLTEFCRRRLH